MGSFDHSHGRFLSIVSLGGRRQDDGYGFASGCNDDPFREACLVGGREPCRGHVFGSRGFGMMGVGFEVSDTKGSPRSVSPESEGFACARVLTGSPFARSYSVPQDAGSLVFAFLSPDPPSFQALGASGRRASSGYSCCGLALFADSNGGHENATRCSNIHQIALQQLRRLRIQNFILINSTNGTGNHDSMVA
jgi:hypothetical protein